MSSTAGLLAVLAVGAGAIFGSISLDPDMNKDKSPEPHHSLSIPMDQSRVYWYWGGSAVVAKRHASLTPPTADRNGFLWNDYPLESVDWEVEFDFKVYSGPHFGGDGMGFWVLGPSVDPVLKSDPASLNGPLFGLVNEFKGFGLAFDTYDNDGDRHNPSMFIISNTEGGRFTGNHDNDYKDDMYRNVPPSIKPEYRCTADYRNKEKPTRVLVRFLHKILHVYVDNNDGSGWQVCLAVLFEQDFKGHHLAFTAHTGQVADAHEIHSITTRYLSSKQKDFDDFLLQHAEGTARRGWGSFAWFLTFMTGVGVNLLCGLEIWNYQQYSSSGINSTLIADNLKAYPWPHTIAHFAMTFFLLLLRAWFGVVINLPVVGYKIWAIRKGRLRLEAHEVDNKIHGKGPLAYPNRMHILMGVYVVTQIYILKQMMS